MVDKIITISIAAYNKEKYINEALDSLLIKEIIDDIEVIVVDDGSTDGTYDIAKKYEENYPYTFKVIHKENAGYGSTVNYSIDNAKGKYFKLLDADDCFDREGFKELVLFLKNVDVDVVFTLFDKYNDKDIFKQKFYSENIVDKFIDSDDFVCYEGYPMHTITYKTSMLRESGVFLKENMLYSDNYYASIPFSKAKSLIFKNIVVYKYRIGQDSQTISNASLIRHSKDLYNIVFDLICYYNDAEKKDIYCRQYIKTRIASTCVDYFVVLMKKNKGNSTLNEIIDFDKKIYNISKDIYYTMAIIDRKASKILILLRLSKYSLYYVISYICKIIL